MFRPCPSYLQAGYQYKREGQTMDQVLFSEPSTKQKVRHVAVVMIDVVPYFYEKREYQVR